MEALHCTSGGGRVALSHRGLRKGADRAVRALGLRGGGHVCCRRAEPRLGRFQAPQLWGVLWGLARLSGGAAFPALPPGWIPTFLAASLRTMPVRARALGRRCPLAHFGRSSTRAAFSPLPCSAAPWLLASSVVGAAARAGPGRAGRGAPAVGAGCAARLAARRGGGGATAARVDARGVRRGGGAAQGHVGGAGGVPGRGAHRARVSGGWATCGGWQFGVRRLRVACCAAKREPWDGRCTGTRSAARAQCLEVCAVPRVRRRYVPRPEVAFAVLGQARRVMHACTPAELCTLLRSLAALPRCAQTPALGCRG